MPLKRAAHHRERLHVRTEVTLELVELLLPAIEFWGIYHFLCVEIISRKEVVCFVVVGLRRLHIDEEAGG